MGKKSNPESKIGQRFGYMEVVKDLGTRVLGKFFVKKYGKYYDKKIRYYLCKCVSCGVEREIMNCNLKSMNCRKCKYKNYIPEIKHPLINVWSRIVYTNYKKSKRGIKLRSKSSAKVCDRWLTSFDNFAADVGSRPAPEYLFSRKDKKIGYTPENFLWKKRTEKNSIYKHLKELTIHNICNDLGLSHTTTRKFVSIELEKEQSELKKFVDRIIQFKSYKVIIFKPEAIEYFRLQKSILGQNILRLRIKDYYLKGIDAEIAAKELNKSVSSIERAYILIESNVFNSDITSYDPERIVGKRIGKLLILKHLGLREKGKFFNKQSGRSNLIKTRFYFCKCTICGREKEVSGSNIGRSGCRYCGKRNSIRKCKHPLQNLWQSMVTPNYIKRNGVRVLRNNNCIPVYESWRNNIFDFAKDIGERPSPEYVFGRIDRRKGYTPDNCKWMTKLERSQIRIFSQKLTMSMLSRKINLSRERIRQITDYAFKHEENELNKFIESVDYSNAQRRVVFKPEVIEYFMLGKHKKTTYRTKAKDAVKLYYSQGKDMETVSKLVNKPIDAIKRYYKMFDKEKNGTN
jgi:hypothetical protein